MLEKRKQNNGSWAKGESGNPKGRIPKGKSLDKQLVRWLEEEHEIESKIFCGMDMLAQIAVNILLTTKATLPNGTILEVGTKDYLDFLK